MSTAERDAAITDFWAFFEATMHRLRPGLSEQAPELTTLLRKLHGVDPRLFFELGFLHDQRQFTISASGRSELFPLADELARKAPELPGWKIQSLLPTRGFGTLTHAAGITFTPESLFFIPLRKKSDKTFLGLTIMVPKGVECTQRTRDAVFLVLDTGLGERLSGEAINYLELTPYVESPARLGYRPINELPGYIHEMRS